MPRLAHTRRLLTTACLLTAAGGLALAWSVERVAGERMEHDAPSTGGRSVEVSGPPELPGGDVWARPGLARLAAEVDEYQLSGTFQTYSVGPDGDGGQTAETFALVDDLRTGRQSLVGVGDRLGVFSVSAVTLDGLVLTAEGRDWMLSLPGVSVGEGSSTGASAAAADRTRSFDAMPALETTPYGKRIADNQWVIDRNAVFDYADGILNNPLRATRLFGSFQAVEDRTPGFRLDPMGEQDFFEAMGLEKGDVIRTVNSMPMKDTRHAAYMLREFMNERMGAVALELEQEGETRKQIYIVR